MDWWILPLFLGFVRSFIRSLEHRTRTFGRFRTEMVVFGLILLLRAAINGGLELSVWLEGGWKKMMMWPYGPFRRLVCSCPNKVTNACKTCCRTALIRGLTPSGEGDDVQASHEKFISLKFADVAPFFVKKLLSKNLLMWQ